MPPVCAGPDTRGSATCSNSTEDDVQLLQSHLADWLTHASVDASVFSRKAQESGDEAIILQVRLKCLPASFAHACLAAVTQRCRSTTHDAGRCDANEPQQPLSCSQHHEQSRSAGQSATSLLQHSCRCCQFKASIGHLNCLCSSDGQTSNCLALGKLAGGQCQPVCGVCAEYLRACLIKLLVQQGLVPSMLHRLWLRPVQVQIHIITTPHHLRSLMLLCNQLSGSYIAPHFLNGLIEMNVKIKMGD